MVSSDFSFVESLYLGGLARRADENFLDLSVVERNIVLAWWAKGIIDNGGFASLYETSINIKDVERAFKVIGAEEAAEACRCSSLVFDSEDVAEQLQERLKFIAQSYNPAEGKDPWYACNKIIWELKDDFDSLVANYVRKNSDSVQRVSS